MDCAPSVNIAGLVLMFIVAPTVYVLLWALARYIVHKFPNHILRY